MKNRKLFRIFSILGALTLSSCAGKVMRSSSYFSSSEEYLSSSSVLSSSSEQSSSLESSSTTSEQLSSSEQRESSSEKTSSSSELSSSSIPASSSLSSSIEQSSSSQLSSSISGSSSSSVSSSSIASSSSSQPSSMGSSEAPSSSSSVRPSSSSSQASCSSSEAPSSSSAMPSSSSSQASSSSSSQKPSSNSSLTPSSSSSQKPSSSSSINSSSSSQASSSSSSSSSSSNPPSTDPLADYAPIATFSKRMPAEFEPVSMVKMCYPINMPVNVYKEIAKDNKILLLVNPASNGNSRINTARTYFTNNEVNLDNVTFIDMPIDDDKAYWVRDFSPFYVFNDKQLSITDFTYNRPQRTEQNAVPSKLAEYFNIPYAKMNLTHTGGNLMQDGRGTAFSDDLVVQENNNNKTKVLNQMKQYTGTDNYVITIDPQGDYIAHIDCWAKIVAPDKIIVARLPQSNSRYQYYEQVAEELANTKCVYGYNYRIYRVDEPGGDVVAPYTNSLIANNHVYMPLGSNSAYNEKALEVYREALPGYEVVGLKGFSASNQNAFLNTDALHCRTHEVPDQNMLFIDTRDVYNGTVPFKNNYVIKSNVVSYANEEISDVTIHYSVNDGEYVSQSMSQYQETTNYTFIFDDLKSGDDVKYYIDANDAKNNYNVDPTCGQLDPHHFVVA